MISENFLINIEKVWPSNSKFHEIYTKFLGRHIPHLVGHKRNIPHLVDICEHQRRE